MFTQTEAVLGKYEIRYQILDHSQDIHKLFSKKKKNQILDQDWNRVEKITYFGRK